MCCLERWKKCFENGNGAGGGGSVCLGAEEGGGGHNCKTILPVKKYRGDSSKTHLPSGDMFLHDQTSVFTWSNSPGDLMLISSRCTDNGLAYTRHRPLLFIMFHINIPHVKLILIWRIT